MVVAFILLFVQLTQAPVVVQSYDSEITVPHGWTMRVLNQGFAWLDHASGATLRVTRSFRARRFETLPQQTAERLANPLGFATIGEPRHFSDSNQEWFEYDIRGNRLTDRRQILYRAIRNREGLTEITFESPEGRYDALISEALSIVASHKSISRKVRVRK
jgi:hypothetical protein